MKRRYTDWLPLGNYSYSGETDYIVFVRKNIKNGMMQFKTAKVHDFGKYKHNFLPPTLIDVRKQWDIITALSPNQKVETKKEGI